VSRAASGVYTGLAAQVVSMAALAVFEEARGRRLAHQIAAFGGDPNAPGAGQVVGAATAFAVLILAVAATTAATGFAYLVWMRRVRPEVPGVALATAWLLPGVNLVAPPILAHRAWREAHRGGAAGHEGRSVRAAERQQRQQKPGTTDGSGDRPRWLALLACWWLSLLTTLGLVLTEPARGGSGLTGLGLLELAVATAAALLCAATVREITALHASSGAERKRAAKPLMLHGGGVRSEERTPENRPERQPELPELACQSRRWGSPGRPRNRPSRIPDVGPMSE
jgi:hypothetical protein